MATFVAAGVLSLAAVGWLLVGSLGLVVVAVALPLGAVVAVAALLLWLASVRRRAD